MDANLRSRKPSSPRARFCKPVARLAGKGSKQVFACNNRGFHISITGRALQCIPFALPDGMRLTTIDNSGALEDAGRAFVDVVLAAAAKEL